MRYIRQKNKRGYSLEEKPPVWGKGPDRGAKLCLLGEAPGATEERQGEPFVGEAGKFLYWGLAEAEIYAGGVWKTNVITRRPPSNDIHSVEAEEALDAERDGLWEELEWLHAHQGLRVVVALGNTPLHAFGINESITKARGSVYEINLKRRGEALPEEPFDFVVIPTFHPSYLNRGARWVQVRDRKGKISDFPKQKNSSDQALIWLEDLKKAKDIAVNGWTRVKERFAFFPSVEAITTYVTEALACERLVAVDIETTSLDPARGDLVCVGLAHDNESAMIISFFKGHKRVYSPHEEATIFRQLERLFTKGKLMFQNSLFDVAYLRAKGIDVDPTRIAHDTLLLHHAISPELQHNLGFIVSMYGRTAYWKGEFANREVGILDMDPVELATYNARDCVVLHQVLRPLLDDLEEAGSKEVYYEESLPLIRPVLQMVETGVKVSTKNLRKWRREVKQRIVAAEGRLRQAAALPDAFNLNSDDDVRLFLFGEAATKYNKAALLDKKKPGTKVYEQCKAMHDILHGTKALYVPTGFKGRRTDTKKRKVDEQGRLALRVHVQNRLERIEGFKNPTEAHKEEKDQILRLLDWLEVFQQYKEAKTLQERYTSFPVRADGRVHTQFIIHGTATGRLASRSPNIQNLPKEEKGVRRLFVADEGKVIISADYSNLEVRTMAYETGDPHLVHVVESGTNMHDENTRVLFGLSKADPMWSEARRAAKTFQFGIQYGGSVDEVYEKVLIQAPKLRLTRADFKRAVDAYFEANPEYGRWRERITEHVLRYRWVDNAFGRRRYFYGSERDIVKEALNFPAQSAAASIINRACVEIVEGIEANRMESRLQGQVHDQLLAEVPRDEANAFVELAVNAMERRVAFRGREVTFPVDVEWGPNWADLTPFERPAPASFNDERSPV